MEWAMVTEWALVTDRVINHALATKMWIRGRAEFLPLLFLTLRLCSGAILSLIEGLTFYNHSGMF